MRIATSLGIPKVSLVEDSYGKEGTGNFFSVSRKSLVATSLAEVTLKSWLQVFSINNWVTFLMRVLV